MKPQKSQLISVTLTGPLSKVQRWSAGRKREAVLQLLRGESIEILSGKLSVEVKRLAQWHAKAVAAIDSAMKERKADPLQKELDSALKRIGELTMEKELLWQRVRKPGPLAKRKLSNWVRRFPAQPTDPTASSGSVMYGSRLAQHFTTRPKAPKVRSRPARLGVGLAPRFQMRSCSIESGLTSKFPRLKTKATARSGQGFGLAMVFRSRASGFCG